MNKIVKRVDKHFIDKEHIMYDYCDSICFQVKNLYNFANYITRQIFILTNKEKLSEEEILFVRDMNLIVDKYNIF